MFQDIILDVLIQVFSTCLIDLLNFLIKKILKKNKHKKTLLIVIINTKNKDLNEENQS
jgi:hypothetical protein